MTGTAPLAGLKVIELARVLAGPWAGQTLSDLGAEVIKVEAARGDDTRQWGPPFVDRDDDRSAAYFHSTNRGKASVTVDLKTPEGQAQLRALLADADILIENFRPGTMERWGLGYEALAAASPGLVMRRVTGYGQTGPYRQRPGFARIAHAFGGLTHLAGFPGGPPVTPGSTSLGDYMTGMYGALGVLMALRERERSGRGQVIDLALFEPVFRVLDELAPAYDAAGTISGPVGMLPSATER